MNKLISLAAIYCKLAQDSSNEVLQLDPLEITSRPSHQGTQQTIQLAPVEISDYTGKVKQVVKSSLDKMGLVNASSDVSINPTSPKDYNVEVVAKNYFGQDGEWIRPSDIFRFILDNLAEAFSFDQGITFTVKVPVDQSKMVNNLA